VIMSKNNEKKAAFSDMVSGLDYAEMERLMEAMFLTPISNLYSSAADEVVWCPPIIKHGPPGPGKTATDARLAHKYGVPHVVNTFGARGEGGYGCTPFPVALKGGQNEGRVAFDFPPPADMILGFPNGVGIMTMDDLALMPPALAGVAMNIFQHREIGVHKLGGGVRLTAATNSVEESGGFDLPGAVANRCGHLAWGDPSGAESADYGMSKMRFSGKRFQDEEVLDLATAEAAVLAAHPDAFSRGSMLFAGFLRAHPHMVRRQPAANTHQLSQAWASPRSIWELAVPAYVGGLIHKLPAKLLHASVGMFVGTSWANEFESYAVNADLPDPRGFLMSILNGTPIFTHSRTRIDRTIVVAQAVTGLVSGLKTPDRRHLAGAVWTWFNTLTDECADIIAPMVKQLYYAKLHGVPEARPVLIKLEPVLTASNG